MTAIKIYKKGNYLIIEDVDNSNRFIEDLLVNVRCSKTDIGSSEYFIYLGQSNETYTATYPYIAMESGVMYATQADWETFIFGCTGLANCTTTGGGGGATNLSYTASPTNGTVNSDTGTDAVIPLVTTVNAGLQSPTDKTKLDGIQSGAEVNVNADWNATSGDAQILNKPTIPSAQVNSDWLATSGVAEILNKPTSLPTANVAHSVKYAEAITKGQAVYVSGADGTNMLVSKADYSTENTSSKTIGLATATGSTNYQGQVITEGLLAGLDTSTATIGDSVWLGANGNLIYWHYGGSTTKPVAPNHLVFIGVVTRVNVNNGEIFVKPQNGFEIEELHNVLIQSLVDKHILYYDNATSLWKNTNINSVIGFTPANQSRLINTTAPLQGGGDLSADRTLSILQATTSQNGYLTSTDWNTFNNKQATLSLTTTGTTGVATLTGSVLNIPNYTSSTNDLFKYNASEFFRGLTYNNNSTTVTAEGGIVSSTTASVLAQSVTSTPFNLKNIRLKYYATVVSTGRYTGVRGSALLWYVGSGFRFVCSFSVSDSVYGSGCRQFYGLQGSTADLTYTDTILVASLQNTIGVGSDALDANLQIFTNDTTGTATKIDLGANFPANRTSGSAMSTIYQIQIYNPSGSSSVYYKVTNLETGNSTEGTITTDLPAQTQGLNFFASRCMGSPTTNTGDFFLYNKFGVYSVA